jgi:hypothetical protein
MEENKYLIVSMPDTHAELLTVIKENAKKHKVSVSQYVRTLLYNSIYIANEKSTKRSRVDAAGTSLNVGGGFWQPE